MPSASREDVASAPSGRARRTAADRRQAIRSRRRALPRTARRGGGRRRRGHARDGTRRAGARPSVLAPGARWRPPVPRSESAQKARREPGLRARTLGGMLKKIAGEWPRRPDRGRHVRRDHPGLRPRGGKPDRCERKLERIEHRFRVIERVSATSSPRSGGTSSPGPSTTRGAEAETMAITDIDEAKLEAFIGLAATEAGAALNVALVTLGDELGLYRAMADGAAGHAGRAGRAHRHARALHPRVAQRAGGERLRRPRGRRVRAAARARARAGGRDAARS